MAAISMETKRREFSFSPSVFILIIINLYNEMSGLKNEQNSFSTSTSPQLLPSLVLLLMWWFVVLLTFRLELE